MDPLHWIYPENTALANPPFLHWHPHQGAVRYILRLRGSGTENEWESPWNFYLPSEILPPGDYRVEVRALDGQGEKLGISRHSFTVPDGAVAFPVSLNRFALEPGTAFVIDSAQLEKLRSGAGGRAVYRDRLLELAGRGIPDDLLRAKEPPLYPDGVWNHGLWEAKNSLAYRMEDGITQQALAFRLTGEKSHLNAAVALMRQVASWPATGSTGVWESDHAAQSLLRALSVGHNLLEDQLSAADGAKIREAILGRGRDMHAFLNPFVGKRTSAGMMNDPDNNHPWFCASALAQAGLALAGREPEAESWIAFSSQLFAGVFLPRGDRHGGWHEGIDYWSYTLFFVCQFADAMRTGAGVDFYRHPWLRNTGGFKVLTHPPAGAHVPFGNCRHAPPGTFDKLVMKRFASVYRDPVLWRYVDALSVDITHGRELVFACLWAGRDGYDPATATTLPRYQHYEDMGWVVANRDPFDAGNQVVFAFRSGPFGGRAFGHGHADQNHFIWTAGGEKLIWDTGYYDGYLTPHNREFAVTSAAHNTLLVDGSGQSVHTAGADGRILSHELEGDILRIRGDASNPVIYGGRLERFIRDIKFEDWRRLRIEDDIVATAPARISWLLQSNYPIDFDPDSGGIVIEGDRHSVRGTFRTGGVAVIGELRHGFPVPPDRTRSRGLEWPDQYHLEIRTVEPVSTWRPVVEFELSGPVVDAIEADNP